MPEKSHCKEYFEYGHCYCLKAKYTTRCPECKKRIQIGECLERLTSGKYGHTECKEKIKPTHCQKYLESDDGCYCFKARRSSNCPACNKSILIGDCIRQHDFGWGHTECVGSIGVKAIEEGYTQGVDYGEADRIEKCTIDEILVGAELSPTTVTQEAEIAMSQISADNSLDDLKCRLFGESHSQETADDDGTFRMTKSETADDDLQIENTFSADDDLDSKLRLKVAEGEQSDGAFQIKKEESKDDSKGTNDGSKLTAEQLKIIHHEPENGEVVCINALAGCGKTTTIAWLCHDILKKDNCKKILYLVFSRKDAEEAEESKKFPGNVEIRTTYSYVFGHYFRNEKVEVKNEYNLNEIISCLRLDEFCRTTFPDLYQDNDRKKIQRRLNVIAGKVRKILGKFQASNDDEVRDCHVDAIILPSYGYSARNSWQEKVNGEQYVSWSNEFFAMVRLKCEILRNEGISSDPGVAITHSSYMKLAQLEKKCLTSDDIVIVDEAQDTTPCEADLFWGKHQRANKSIYLFGDIYQQLYRFRGAGNVFKERWGKSDELFALAGSFRFGKNIAAYATCILETLGGMELVGRAPYEGVISEDDKFHTGVVLCRTNNGMYMYLYSNSPKKWCYLDNRLKRPAVPNESQLDLIQKIIESVKTNREGGTNEEPVYMDMPLNFNYKGEVFESIPELTEYAKAEKDKHLIGSLKILDMLPQSLWSDVSRGRDSIHTFFHKIRESFCPLENDETPDIYNGVVVSTVHKAKGLEFNNVSVFDDCRIPDIKVQNFREKMLVRDNLNILYVAITRTKRNLFMSKSLQEHVKELRDKARKAARGENQRKLVRNKRRRNPGTEACDEPSQKRIEAS